MSCYGKINLAIWNYKADSRLPGSCEFSRDFIHSFHLSISSQLNIFHMTRTLQITASVVKHHLTFSLSLSLSLSLSRSLSLSHSFSRFPHLCLCLWQFYNYSVFVVFQLGKGTHKIGEGELISQEIEKLGTYCVKKIKVYSTTDTVWDHRLFLTCKIST